MPLVAQEIPKVGLVMEEVKVVRWLKNVGDTVTAGEPLLEVETEKSVVEIEATATGRLTRDPGAGRSASDCRRSDRLDRVRRGARCSVLRRRRHARLIRTSCRAEALDSRDRGARRRAHPKFSGRAQTRCRARHRSRRNRRHRTARPRSAGRCATMSRRRSAALARAGCAAAFPRCGAHWRAP